MDKIKNNLSAVMLALMSLLAIVVIGMTFIIRPALTQNLSADNPEMPFGEYLAGRHALLNKDYRAAADFYLDALSLDPENVSLNQSALSVLITDGRLNDAALISNRLKEIEAETSTSKLILFFEEVKTDEFDEALGRIDGLSDTGIINLIRPFFKAWIFAEQGKNSEVEEIIGGFQENNTFNFFNYYQSGLLFEYMGDTEKAEEYYSKSLDEKGLLNLRAVEAYGHILRKQNKNDQAIAVYNEYLETSPENEHLKVALNEAIEGKKPVEFVATIDDAYAEIFYSISTILMQDNVKRVATNFLQYAIYFKYEFPLARFLQAQIFESDEYYEGAAFQLDKIPNDSPLYFQSKIQRAWLLDDMDQPEEALIALKKLDDEYPDNRMILNSIAEFYRMHERYSEAILTYDEIVENLTDQTAKDWLLYYTRAIVLDQEKRWPEAETDFKKALELRPEQPMVLNYLAYSWVDRGVNYDEAKKMLERAVELRPNDGYIVDSLGWALFKMGNDEAAALVLERAAQLQTSDWAINDHLGDVYWTVGRKNEARFQWRHALSLSPDEDKILNIKTKIKNGYIKTFD